MAFGLMYTPISTNRSEAYPNGREYGAFLYNESTETQNCFTFGDITAGEEGVLNWPALNGEKVHAGSIHTHGAYRSIMDGDANFFTGRIEVKDSAGKIIAVGGDGLVALFQGVDQYMVTPGGTLKCLAPTWVEQNIQKIPDTDPAVRIVANGLSHY